MTEFEQLRCPACQCPVDPEDHGSLVFDAQVWCSSCHAYPPAFLETRSLAELQAWCDRLCQAFAQPPVQLLEDPEARYNWRLYWRDNKCLLAEANHRHRLVLLYPPGQRLTTLCHELAHLFTGQDHTPVWARTFAQLIHWLRQSASL